MTPVYISESQKWNILLALTLEPWKASNAKERAVHTCRRHMKSNGSVWNAYVRAEALLRNSEKICFVFFLGLFIAC